MKESPKGNEDCPNCARIKRMLTLPTHSPTVTSIRTWI